MAVGFTCWLLILAASLWGCLVAVLRGVLTICDLWVSDIAVYCGLFWLADFGCFLV